MDHVRRFATLLALGAAVAACSGFATAPTAPAQPASAEATTSASAPSGSADPGTTASRSPSPSEPSSPPTSPTPLPLAPPASSDLARYTWFKVNWSTEGEGTEGPANPTGDTLIHVTGGTLAGRLTVDFHLRERAPVPPVARGAAPFDDGPFGRYGVYGFVDPGGSQLHRVDLLTGTDTTVLRDHRVIHRAVFDPARNTYYLALLDGTRRTDLGIWRFRPGVDASPVRLEAPTGLEDAGGGPWRRLFLAPSGSALVVVDCALVADPAHFECTARSIDPATGVTLESFGPVPDTIIGVTDRWFVVDGRAIALDGSQARNLPRRCGLSTLTQVAGDDTLVFETSGPTCSQRLYEVTALDLQTGVTRLVWSMPNFKVTFDPALVPSEEHVSVPAGDVLLAPSNIAAQADSGPGLLLSVADGTARQLPPWPVVPPTAP